MATFQHNDIITYLYKEVKNCVMVHKINKLILYSNAGSGSTKCTS